MIVAMLAAVAAQAAAPDALPRREAPMPNLYTEPGACKDAPVKVVGPDGKPVPIKLADLPKGMVILAVDRSVEGCRVITVGYGRAKTPAPPAADPPKPAGEPPNRR
jgi:hypothetical protein